MRALEAAGVTYEAATYDPTIGSAEGVADALGVAPSDVYKTLVMARDGGEKLLVMVPGGREVTPRVLARAIGARSVALVPKADAERLTGLQTGGIGALALLGRKFTVLIDREALGREWIFVNGGRRGLNLRVPVADLILLTGATPVPTSSGAD